MNIMKKQFYLRNVSLFIFAFLVTCLFKNCDCGGKSGPVNINVEGAKTSGSATIALQNLNNSVTAGDKKFISVSFTGSLTSGTEGSGSTSFFTQKTIEVTSNSVNPVPSVNRVNLKPGIWNITVSAGTWTATCSKTITADSNLSVTFSYNSKDCQ